MLLTSQKALREERVTQVAQYVAFRRQGSEGDRVQIREMLLAEDVVTGVRKEGEKE